MSRELKIVILSDSDGRKNRIEGCEGVGIKKEIKMKYEKLIIAKSENNLLRDLLNKVYSKDAVHQDCYNRLRLELINAKVVDDNEVPKDVVRLNSVIDVETPFGYIEGYQLVLPKDSNPAAKKLSILTPMGSALIGYAEGDKVVWSFPKGEETITIKQVHAAKTEHKISY